MPSKTSTPIEHHRVQLEAGRAYGERVRGHEKTLDELRSKLAEAQHRAETADASLAQLAKEQRNLAPGAYEGDEEAVAALADIDNDTSRLHRDAQLAKEASHHYTRLITEVEGQLEAAKAARARDRLESLSRKRYAAGRAAEEAMRTLLERLDAIEAIHQEQARLAATELDDQRMLMHPPERIIAPWALQRLRQYTGRPADGRLSAPLPEQDTYAKKGT